MRTVLALAAALATAPLYASWDCSNTAPRSAALPVAGATRIVVIGRAGWLKVSGHPGATEVRATGTACSSSRSELGNIQLRATRRGGEIRIEAEVPEVSFGMWGERKLDFEVMLPPTIPLQVIDGSGAMTIEDVHGTVRIHDGSGGIDVHHVTGSVILNDGSGSVDVTDVGGDFVVESKGSGHVSYARVRGRVDVPRRR